MEIRSLGILRLFTVFKTSSQDGRCSRMYLKMRIEGSNFSIMNLSLKVSQALRRLKEMPGMLKEDLARRTKVLVLSTPR